MNRISIWAVPIFVLLTLPMANSVQQNMKLALVAFMDKLSSGVVPGDSNWGWNTSSDPCIDKWMGVNCTDSQKVRKVVLEGFHFNGTLDAASLCMAVSIEVLSLKGNNVGGPLPVEIGNCNHLTHFFVSGNKFSGPVPASISRLTVLKRLDISNNDFDGQLPDLSKISLLSFFAQDNNLSGSVSNLDFSNLVDLNVSNNNFSGPIPDTEGKFKANSFLGNPGLCGAPLPNACPPSPTPLPSQPKSKRSSSDRYFMYLGYIVLILVAALIVTLTVVRKNRSKRESNDAARESIAGDNNSKSTSTSSDTRNGMNKQETRSEYSITSAESGLTSSSLLLLTTPGMEGLKFEDLLRAPAELLGRGKHGSLYKVTIGDGSLLVVKRIRSWDIPGEDFKNRMVRIDQVRHPRIMAPVALYCSRQEKLLVYQYQPNGSLFNLLHGSQGGRSFDWGSRLRVAAVVGEALAFMHNELREDGIAHGNLKSTNILFDKNMEPCITEYGLMLAQSPDPSSHSPTSNDLTEYGTLDAFKADAYGFGVILLELLTGKLVRNNGIDLTKWVHSVVREEWTVEVFDKALISEGVSEERMVNLLQVALKCINPSLDQRPSMNQVVSMVNMIKEDEDRSNGSDP